MYVVLSKVNERAKWVTLNTPFADISEAFKKARWLRQSSFISQVRELGPPLVE